MLVPIKDIKIKKRVRKDLGNLDNLKNSYFKTKQERKKYNGIKIWIYHRKRKNSKRSCRYARNITKLYIKTREKNNK